MPGPKTRRLSFRVIVLRALLGLLGLYVLGGATYGYASKSTVNHLTGVLHDNLNEGKNNYDSIQVHLFDGLPDFGVLEYLVNHWLVIAVVLMGGYIVYLHRSHKKARTAATPHSSSTS
jgi:hypothetical protein